MNRTPHILSLAAALAATAAFAADVPTSSPATAPASTAASSLSQPITPESISATGRVMATTIVRPSPRINGHLISLGTTADNKPLDAGVRVKKGDILFNLDKTTYENAQVAAAATLASAQATLDNLKAPPRPERIEQLKQVITELQARYDERKLDEERYKRLVEEKTAPAKRLEEAQTELAVAITLLAGAKSRLAEAENGATKTEIAMVEARIAEANAALKAANDDLRDTSVRAPFDALITRRLKSVGDFIASNPPVEVFELLDTSSLEVELRIPETYFTRITPGATTVSLKSALRTEPIAATVTRAIPDIDPTRGTFPVRVSLPPNTPLIPGSFITAEISLDPDHSGSFIPASAVLTKDAQPFIFIITPDHKLARFPITITNRLTEHTIIKETLPAGSRIITQPIPGMKEGDPAP